jgi:FkbM family methyltransferase
MASGRTGLRANPVVRAVIQSAPYLFVRRVLRSRRRSRYFESSTDFWLADALRRPGIRSYRDREHGFTFYLRHDCDDAFIFDEIFGWLSRYEPPPEVTDLLASRGGSVSVTDVGANIGLFGLWCEAHWSVQSLTAIEADPENSEILRRVVQANDLQQRWTVVEGFASTADGVVSFLSGRSSRSRAAASGEPGNPTPTLDLFRHLPGSSILKMDVEGAEWAILEDPRFSGHDVPVLVVEFHGQGAPSADPAGSVEDLLERAGYATSITPHAVSDDPFEGQGVVWAWKPAS